MQIFSVHQVSEHIDQIATPFGVSMFFVKGKDSGLLIDTGMGVGDLKAYLDHSYSIPYTIALTHGHCDHAGGSSQFEQVYLNALDFDLEKWHATKEHRIFDVFHAPFGTPVGITEDDFVKQKDDDYIPLEDGYVFDLGDVHVQFISVPGHTHGCMIPIIPEDRIAIFGDDIGENTLMHFKESTSVETYMHSMEKLQKYENEYDRVLRFHGSGESKKIILEDMIELCSEVISGTDAKLPKDFLGFKGRMAREEKHLGKEGNMIYDPNKILEVTGCR